MLSWWRHIHTSVKNAPSEELLTIENNHHHQLTDIPTGDWQSNNYVLV